MAETFRSDGKAVEVTLENGAVTKGDVVLEQGFHGIAMADAASGEDVALEIALREHEVNVGGVTANKGDTLYLASDGSITTTTTDRPFLKVTQEKDANNYVWGVLLPQE